MLAIITNLDLFISAIYSLWSLCKSRRDPHAKFSSNVKLKTSRGDEKVYYSHNSCTWGRQGRTLEQVQTHLREQGKETVLGFYCGWGSKGT